MSVSGDVGENVYPVWGDSGEAVPFGVAEFGTEMIELALLGCQGRVLTCRLRHINSREIAFRSPKFTPTTR
jgi:hypothetical protein